MTELEKNGQNGQRPVALSVLCVLSFIGSGMSALSNLFVYLNHGMVKETIESGTLGEMGIDLSFVLRIDRIYFLLGGLLNIISFTGVRHMWSLRKAGFHLYAISQLLILIVSTIYVYKPSGVFPGFDLLLASFFILLYLRFREIMN
jgi:hypothetical protein